MSTVKIFSKNTLSALFIASLLFFTGCYPIEESPTGPVLSGEAIVTIGEDKYTASASASCVDAYVLHPITTDILIQIEDTVQLRIIVNAFEPEKFTYQPNAREFSARLDYDDPSTLYLIDRGSLRIDSFTEDHVRGALDIYMMPLSGGNLVDHHNLIQVSGEFNATWKERIKYPGG